VDARLYFKPASHPCTAAELMLQYKGIDYKRVDLMPMMSRVAVRLLGFPRPNVPAMKIDGRRVQGSRQISRELERLQPEPSLFPADPEKRAAVEEAERFGEDELQHPIRQIILWTLAKNTSVLRSYAEGARLGIPIGLAMLGARPIMALSARVDDADDAHVRQAVAALPALLQQVDDWIEAGLLNGGQLNVADFQVAPSLGLAMTLDDLRPAIEGRPAGQLAKRLVPDYPGKAPPIIPAAWLEPLRGQPAAA
jgi:glutathione S-transferase